MKSKPADDPDARPMRVPPLELRGLRRREVRPRGRPPDDSFERFDRVMSRTKSALGLEELGPWSSWPRGDRVACYDEARRLGWPGFELRALPRRPAWVSPADALAELLAIARLDKADPRARWADRFEVCVRRKRVRKKRTRKKKKKKKKS